ncbi:MAG: type II secretion system protein [Epsilonproteobacteria bacterium]|nr:type II secretion system protein [Campylobacterota bacterium]
MKKNKKAFSLIEVIFVLVILGIVASLASQIIVQVYENYIIQKSIYKVNTKTELVANEIANRLTYRIQGTTISKDHIKFLNGTATDTDWLPIEDVQTGGTKYTTIEWIGYDNDSFASHATPNWSGVANYETASQNGFETPGSNLDNVANIISNLSNGRVDLSDGNHSAAVLFMHNENYYNSSDEYNPLCMGMIPELLATSNTDCIFPVVNDTNKTFAFTTTTAHPAIVPKIITERYKLAWSAYAIAPEDLDGDGHFDLVLYSNYQPWNGDSYLNATRHVLMKNLSVFKFSENGGTLRFKICAVEQIGPDNNISSCKVKVVIR